MSDMPLPKRPPAGPTRVFKADEHDPEIVARMEAGFGKGMGKGWATPTS